MPSELQNEVTVLIAWLHSFEFVVLATFWFTNNNDVNCLLQTPKLLYMRKLSYLSHFFKLCDTFENHGLLYSRKQVSTVASTLGFEEKFKQKY